MKKIKFGVIVILAMLFTGPSLLFAKDSGKPTITIMERHYRFGEVNEGETITHDFLVLNSGDKVLEIQKVSPG